MKRRVVNRLGMSYATGDEVRDGVAAQAALIAATETILWLSGERLTKTIHLERLGMRVAGG